MNYRTPLGRARGLGSAGAGSRDWWRQRVSALVLIPLVLWLAFPVMHLPTASYEESVEWVRAPWNTFLTMAVIGIAFYHGMLGLKVILEDYVHSTPLKMTAILGAKLLCACGTLAAMLAVFRIVFTN